MSGWKPIKIAFDVTTPSTKLDESLCPIIFLHGMTLSKEDWNGIDQSVADATHRKVYKLDVRNHGDSEWSDAFDFTVLVKDLEHFMDQNKIQKAVFIGHSMGGRASMELAASRPERIERFIVEDMSPQEMKEPIKKMIHGYLELYEGCLQLLPPDADLEKAKKLAADFIVSKLPEAIATDHTKQVFDVAGALTKTENGFQWKTNLSVIKRTFEDAFKSLEGSSDKEALFIYGSLSPNNVVGDKEFIVEKFPKAVFKPIEGATHLVHKEFPKEFVEAVVEFVTKK